jgi:hypothetical protein
MEVYRSRINEKWHLAVIALLIAATLMTCIDPFAPMINKFQSTLVVDALLTDEDASNSVVLSRTKKHADGNTEMVTGARVIISDDSGNSTTLKEIATGIYKTDSLSFRGIAGRAYTLNIKTSDGEEYNSDQCLMNPVLDIDSIYYKKDQQLADNEIKDGLRIYLDSKGSNDSEFYRWTYDEWWKIRVSNPKEYNYVNDSTFTQYLPRKEICWGHNRSDGIIIKSSDEAFSVPVTFIDPEKSPRLLIQYCIDVRQLSISKKEYEFWNQMSMINESGGDIFDKQPFQVNGNIHNTAKPGETVLGYFQVSSAKHLRKYITYNNAEALGIPHYVYPCQTFMVSPIDFSGTPEPMTFFRIYWMYINSGCIFVKPLFTQSGGLSKFEFTTSICADCTLSGSLTKPDFWVDIE